MKEEDRDWEHAGGKLAELGPEALTDTELLSIIIAPGTPGNPADKIAENIIKKYGSIEKLAGRPLEELYEIRGMGDVKIIRLAAALELARRAAYGILNGEKAQAAKK